MICGKATEASAIAVVILLTSVNCSVNLAQDENVTFSSNQDPSKYNFSYTVDGNTAQSPVTLCSYTALKALYAWWRVDLGDTYNVETITIYYLNQGTSTLRHFIGYQLYYSNTSAGNITSGELCYSNEGQPAPPSVVEHDCDYLARYVTVYKTKQNNVYDNRDGAVLELCEVEVYGCPVGKFGNGTCDSSCSGCTGGMCNSTTGVCKDDVCTTGFYGPKCNQACPKNCKNNVCNFYTGSCVDSGCNIGYYGMMCRKPCPKDCNNKICNFRNGICYGCEDGYFGEACNISCPGNCERRCDFISGECEIPILTSKDWGQYKMYGEVGVALGTISFVTILVASFAVVVYLRRIKFTMRQDSVKLAMTDQRKPSQTYEDMGVADLDSDLYEIPTPAKTS